MNVTPHMLHLLHHTLGLRLGQCEPFRNHFLAGPGHHDQADLEALELAGLMHRAKAPAFCDDGDVVFFCTDKGKEYAIEHLPPEPTRTKYGEYLRDDFCESFAEFLGINKPKYESRWVLGDGYEYRMFRLDRSVRWAAYPEIAGDWCKTKKAAKESYKAALKSKKKSLASAKGSAA